VLAPVAEEILFRGVLLGWLTRIWNRIPRPKSRYFHDELPAPNVPGTDWASAQPPAPPLEEFPELDQYQPTKPRTSWLIPNILTSLAFAGVHFPQWPAPVPIFFLSLGLGVLYQRTGKLTAPIVLHATFNGVSTLLMFLVVLSGIPLTPDAKPLDPLPPPAVKKANPPVPKFGPGERPPNASDLSAAKD
jgi:hypothetical protein